MGAGSQGHKGAWKELAPLFLRLGTTAFGGPAAHIAMMEDEVVKKRGWLSRDQFLDLLGAASLIPGPSSTEVAIYIGYLRAGWVGLLLGGSCFILPAAVLATTLAWAYIRFGSLPQCSSIFYGIKPVVIAIIAHALWRLARSAIKTKFLGIVSLAAVTLRALGLNELVLLFGAGFVTALVANIARQRRVQARLICPPSLASLAGTLQSATGATGTIAASVGLLPLFLFFLKVGAVVFGSGYVLIAFLRGDLVERWHWLTNSQLLDAVVVGQMTPGPVFTTATFIGYLLAGAWGAVVATVGIFLPSFFLVAVSSRLVSQIRKSLLAGSFLDGVNVAALALIVTVTYQLGRAALVDLVTLGTAIISALLLIRFRLNSLWLVAAGAAVGILTSAFGSQ